MKNEIVCPDIEKINYKVNKGKPNFPLKRCAERRRQNASGCKGCMEGLHWATKYYVWWPIWEKEREK